MSPMKAYSAVFSCLSAIAGAENASMQATDRPANIKVADNMVLFIF